VSAQIGHGSVRRRVFALRYVRKARLLKHMHMAIAGVFQGEMSLTCFTRFCASAMRKPRSVPVET
jgi:hypothetical protein